MILTVHIKPNAKNNQVKAWLDSGTVKIDIAAPAVDGKANRALIDFLAKRLGVAKSLITIKRGHSSRVKHVKLPDSVDLSALK
ncbi:DUF167 domain-containing protein [Candidatus Uhrbacteria bacterium]|jgi:uncharacterized protein|nr:DUF167 domain-containing protein [Candidatus Uhrbacteria bacterium]MBT7717171.1 DUF167 domain-containing protein [Candidatus Uhrbacteria bacterium]